MEIRDKIKEIGKIISQQQRTSEELSKIELHKVNDKSFDKSVGDEGCPECKGIGFVLITKDGVDVFRRCPCVAKKISRERFARTEIANKENYTFKGYKATEDWQKEILEKAKDYVKNFRENQGSWFYIGGQVGSGKTHICTAILRNLGELNNISYEYIKCDEELEKLKQHAYSEEKYDYAERVQKLKTIELLFVDDLYKKKPSEADISKLFDILNYRYLNNKTCIFSSEHSLFEILIFDEAVGSRIFEKCKDYNIEIAKDLGKNYRLK